jgi:hypothetical protein
VSWRDLRPSDDGTHHLRDGRPVYAERFDTVLKFHAPGLAPVQRGDAAWHIGTDGTPAYARRFRRTFGFYEGLATVESDDGWHHVTPEGRDACADRYAWCGNYQEQRCAVRSGSGRYHHIDPTGHPRGEANWRYAGDFRDGVAVVQGDDGRSTHVTCDGALLHGRWFEDLDVFHKGFARARDERGWTHVDPSGGAAYARRFAMVEPFYNGQARVERLDGALEVIDPDGHPLLEIRPPRRSEFAALSSDLVGYWRTQAIATAVGLGVFEALPGATDEVAERCNLRIERATRILRALTELHLVEAIADDWRLTARGAYLTRTHPLTLADASGEYAGRLGARWADLRDALLGGDAWAAADIFAEVARDDAGARGHHRMLRSYARHDYATIPAALGLRGDEVIVDAGGGTGALAEGLLRHYPRARVVLLDRPEVAAFAEVPVEFRSRLDVLAADFFAPWPVRGDAVVLARVLHDWDDTRAAQVLRYARAALAPGGRVFVIEMVLPDEGGGGGLCDLHLLVATGGKERTRAAFARLLSSAGLVLRDVVRVPALLSILIAEAA